MEQQILDGNKLIAEFMGAIISQDYAVIEEVKQDGLGFYFKKNDVPEAALRYSSQGLKYHRSWDWLIPVIDKITLMDEYYKYVGYNSNMTNDGHIHINTRFIESTYKDVIEFIKWYNQNKKSNE